MSSAGTFQRHAAAARPARYGDTAAAAAYLGMSVWAVYRLVRLGLPCVRVGKRNLRFDFLRVEQWLEERQMDTPRPGNVGAALALVKGSGARR